MSDVIRGLGFVAIGVANAAETRSMAATGGGSPGLVSGRGRQMEAAGVAVAPVDEAHVHKVSDWREWWLAGAIAHEWRRWPRGSHSSTEWSGGRGGDGGGEAKWARAACVSRPRAGPVSWSAMGAVGAPPRPLMEPTPPSWQVPVKALPSRSLHVLLHHIEGDGGGRGGGANGDHGPQVILGPASSIRPKRTVLVALALAVLGFVVEEHGRCLSTNRSARRRRRWPRRVRDDAAATILAVRTKGAPRRFATDPTIVAHTIGVVGARVYT